MNVSLLVSGEICESILLSKATNSHVLTSITIEGLRRPSFRPLNQSVNYATARSRPFELRAVISQSRSVACSILLHYRTRFQETISRNILLGK